MGTCDAYIIKMAEEQLQREINADNGIEFIIGAFSDRLPCGWTIEMIQALANGYTLCKDEELTAAAKQYLANTAFQNDPFDRKRKS